MRVVIGEGKGENWWCVLFPPLLVDISNSVSREPEVTEVSKNMDALKNGSNCRQYVLKQRMGGASTLVIQITKLLELDCS